MSVSSDRVVCPRCGANNFATQAACWKCGTALSASARAGGLAAPPSPAGAVQRGAPLSPLSAQTADPAVAVWSAVALAVFFPFVAVPVGLVFLMLDDRRKIQIGKITLFWGVILSLLHFLVTWWLLAEAVAQVHGLLPGVPGRSQPRPDDPVPPLQFPGYPR